MLLWLLFEVLSLSFISAAIHLLGTAQPQVAVSNVIVVAAFGGGAKIPSVGLGTFQAENSGALAKILNSTCMNELIRESAEIWWIPNKGYEGKEETELYFLCTYVIILVHAAMEGLENMAFVANAVSLLTYFFGFMYFSLTKSATTLTNFMETAFLLSLVGGFINDTCLSRFKTCVIFASMELLVSTTSTYQLYHILLAS
ncbi:hypothetical protein Ahy_A07g035293 [Arachis hypogaea]|uniref:Uncharacterized protein n=1 Tax=Arachis hypogaea TaxID=3818 RepID=A0A445CDI3_ARAHY|nr:hypothetical protein Ahy_A07g035293 [Arachis hypogaea]